VYIFSFGLSQQERCKDTKKIQVCKTFLQKKTQKPATVPTSMRKMVKTERDLLSRYKVTTFLANNQKMSKTRLMSF